MTGFIVRTAAVTVFGMLVVAAVGGSASVLTRQTEVRANGPERPQCPASVSNTVFLPCDEIFHYQPKVGEAIVPFTGQVPPTDGDLLDLTSSERSIGSTDGVLETDIAIKSGTPDSPMLVGSKPYRVSTYEGQNRLGGVVASYNGVFPGPTLLAAPGDTLKIHFHDRRMSDSTLQASPDFFDPVYFVPESSNFHTHGVLTSPRGNGDNIYRTFEPGNSYLTEIDIPDDHDQGLDWYHPHVHRSTAPQVYGGLAGLLQIGSAVGGGHEPFLENHDHKMLVFNGFALAPSKEDPELYLLGPTSNGLSPDFHDPNPVAVEGGIDNNPQYKPTHFVNGQLNPVIRMRPNETQVWLAANVSPFTAYNLAALKLGDDGKIDRESPLFRTTMLAQDGNDHFTPIPGYLIRHRDLMQDYRIAPGQRLAWAITAPEQPGTYHLLNVADGAYTSQVDNLPPMVVSEPPQSLVPSMILATIEVEGKADRRAVPSFPAPQASPDLEGEPVLTRQVAFDFDEHFLRGRVNFGYFPDVGVFQGYSGDLERWVLSTYSQVSHPFHIHQGQFLIEKIEYYEDQALTKLRSDLPENPVVNRFPRKMDTFAFPARSKVYMRMRTSDYTGKFVMHCHILLHEDSGMMASVKVSPPRGELMTAVASGPRQPPLISLARAETGERAMEIQPFESGYRGGVSTAIGHLSGPYRSLVAASRLTGTPVVRVFEHDNAHAPVLEFKPFGGDGDGATVAAGDIDGDAIEEIIVGSGPGTRPSVAVYDIIENEDRSLRASLLLEVPVFDAGYGKTGVRVSSGDVDGDNWDDIIAASGPGMTNRVSVLGGQILSEAAISDDEFGIATGDPDLDRELKLSICKATSTDSIIVDTTGIVPGSDGLNVASGLLGGGFASFPPVTKVGFNPPVDEPYRDLIALTPAASHKDPQVLLYKYDGPGGHAHPSSTGIVPKLSPVAVFSPFPGETSPEGGLGLAAGLTTLADPDTPIEAVVSAMGTVNQKASWFDRNGQVVTRDWAR